MRSCGECSKDMVEYMKFSIQTNMTSKGDILVLCAFRMRIRNLKLHVNGRRFERKAKGDKWVFKPNVVVEKVNEQQQERKQVNRTRSYAKVVRNQELKASVAEAKEFEVYGKRNDSLGFERLESEEEECESWPWWSSRDSFSKLGGRFDENTTREAMEVEDDDMEGGDVEIQIVGVVNDVEDDVANYHLHDGIKNINSSDELSLNGDVNGEGCFESVNREASSKLLSSKESGPEVGADYNGLGKQPEKNCGTVDLDDQIQNEDIENIKARSKINKNAKDISLVGDVLTTVTERKTTISGKIWIVILVMNKKGGNVKGRKIRGFDGGKQNLMLLCTRKQSLLPWKLFKIARGRSRKN
ncbi:hypothetical protein SLEP1_g35635 [Rubroshorea leprosula]|uniref:Uncharacterized protein n=1 Tax=Rubroshorea leprosula TaxID=152421 RepID=A0AAV5KNX2_9ROSI|nr:hypothetical protein SLEP1_g35635 [Rubroshorea leprosula]